MNRARPEAWFRALVLASGLMLVLAIAFVGSSAVAGAADCGGSAASLAFVHQPTTTQTNTAITPAVTVQALDSCGHPVSGASVSIALANNPSGGTLTGTTTQTTNASGIASFAGLEIDQSGSGYTLVASSAGAPSLTSDAFDVVDFLCTVLPCVLDDPENITSVRVDSKKALPAPLGLSTSDPGIPFGDGNCGSLQSLGRVVTITPDDSVASDIVLEVTFRYGAHVIPDTRGLSHVRFCANDGPETPWYEVFNCGKPAVPKCISKRNAAGNADLLVTALFGWTDPDWGGFG
jgi:hypothetical protein